MSMRSSFLDMPDEARRALGSRIRIAVKAAGGATRAHKIIGCSYSMLHTWCRGESAPPLLSMLRLSDASGCSLYWIADGRPPREVRP